MPALELLDQRTPSSVVRHRPLGSRLPPDYRPQVARAKLLRDRSTDTAGGNLKRPLPPDDADALDDPSLADDSTRFKPASRQKVPAVLRKPRAFHPFLLLGLGMLCMLLVWIALVHLVSWMQTTLDDLHYGRPRVFQMDAVVGHHDSQATPTHLLAINLGGQIEVIEWPGGDGSHARIYLGPRLFGQGRDLAPVTLHVRDVNGDHRPDIVLHIQETEMVLINEQDGFRPLHPGEQISQT